MARQGSARVVTIDERETMFETKADVAEWELIYRHIKPLEVGATVTYDELSNVLGRPFDSARGPFYRANTELLDKDRRGLVNVRNTGYRVIEAEEHETPARSQHKLARRRLKKSRQWLSQADRSRMSPTIAAKFDQMELTVSRYIDMTNQISSRVERVEKALTDSRQKQVVDKEAVDEKLDKLSAALKRAGIEVE